MILQCSYIAWCLLMYGSQRLYCGSYLSHSQDFNTNRLIESVSKTEHSTFQLGSDVNFAWQNVSDVIC